MFSNTCTFETNQQSQIIDFEGVQYVGMDKTANKWHVLEEMYTQYFIQLDNETVTNKV